jgi:PhoD-like phosphatase
VHRRPVPDRTVDARAPQLVQFLTDLVNSTARYKLIINEDQMQQYYALPYDRWEGYWWERTKILQTIDQYGITGVEWLTTDVHAQMAHTVDYYNPEPGSYGGVQGSEEYTAGPVATQDFRSEINELVGDDTASSVRAFLINVNANTCAELGGDGNPGAPFYGYKRVTIDATTHTLSIEPFDYTNFKIAGNGVQGAGRDYFCYDFVTTVVSDAPRARTAGVPA